MIATCATLQNWGKKKKKIASKGNKPKIKKLQQTI
jgi:hypothetical protein